MSRIFFIILGFICAVSYGQSYRLTHQIEVEEKPFGDNNLYYSNRFENEFYPREDLSFTTARPNKYVAEKVKMVELYNNKDQLIYRCELDKAGKVVKTGIQGRNYFITVKSVDLNKSHRISEQAYFKDDVLMRIDTSIFYVHKYAFGDTILTFHERRTISYWQGGLINKKNRYLNVRYLNKKIDESESPFPIQPVSKGKKKRVYLKKAFNTNYDSLSLILIKDVRYFSSPFHNWGHQVLVWEDIQAHPFFELYNQKSIEYYLVDGVEFEEPLQLQERMYCGNSDYRREHYYDGRSNRYSRLENGLYKQYLLYYYPIDPNPPERKPQPKDSVKMGDEYVEIEPPHLIGEYQPRLSTPEITTIYTYKYVYFE